MNRYIAVLLILAGLSLSVGTALAGQEAGEGYARPTYPELIQTLVLMGGSDINSPKVADEYGRLVYCNLYKKNYTNDVLWEKLRTEMVARALKKKEYFRVKYEVVGIFYLGRYDFKREYFPISDKTPIINVGTISLLSVEDTSLDCSGQDIYSSVFPMTVVAQLNEPLTIRGFKVSLDRVEKLMVRLEEAGDADHRVYGRIRVAISDAKGVDYSSNNTSRIVLNGKVISVDFFIDKDLTKPIASIRVNKE
jgi:hypothetical protein